MVWYYLQMLGKAVKIIAYFSQACPCQKRLARDKGFTLFRHIGSDKEKNVNNNGTR
jgi:hypothetical protein